MPWELSSERSVYLQLMEKIKQKILSGEYSPGQRLDSVRDLAVEASVNPNTMQRALTELEREGLLYTQRTNGRFVAEDINLIESERNRFAIAEVKHFMTRMKQLGIKPDAIHKLIDKIEDNV